MEKTLFYHFLEGVCHPGQQTKSQKFSFGKGAECMEAELRSQTVFDDNFSYFSSKPYFVTPHLNRIIQAVQMRVNSICFYAELTKIIPNYHQILPLI